MSYHSRQPSIASSLLSSTTFNHSSTSNIHKIGPWKLGKTLGQGSTGRVLLAEHTTTGQKAAVKVVSKSVLNSLESIGDDKGRDAAGLAYGIEREIIIMKLLNHPDVLRLYDVWETSKSLYLILEYVEGGELFDLLVEKGPLEEYEAVKFFRQIIMGASYCHALGICHRDLKPENLLLDVDLNVKLADFGMAALENNDRLLETSCGSPHYAAPEIVSGKHYHGFESDVWSCGVILFALLTGRLPFDDENIRNLLLKVQAGQFEMPPELSSEAKDLIYKMLEVNPEKRIQTHKILEHPLLLKYEISSKDAKTLNELPSPNTYLNQLGDVNEIDSQILSNLITLYHGRSKEQIVSNLLKKESTTEKIFYFLLLRYRHNQSANSSLLRSLSIARSINHPSHSHSDSSSSSNLIKTPRKSNNRRSLISASSSHRKSVSFQRSPHKKTDSIQYQQSQAQPPVPRNLIDDFKSAESYSPPSNTVAASTSSSSSGSNHPPQQVTATTVTNNRFSITPPRSQSRKSLTISKNTAGVNASLKRRSIRNSMLPNKRNSITTKLISVYAKLSADSDWNFIDKETKRTSSDFATLCDDIFDYEEKEKLRKEAERLEAERLEKERIEREEKERLEREERERIAAERKAKEDEKLRLLAEKEALLKEQGEPLIDLDDQNEIEEVPLNQNQFRHSKHRSVSSPTKRASNLLDADEINKIQQRVISNPFTSRPKSKLDPGLNYTEDSYDAKFEYEADEIVSKAIRRSKFLGSRFDLTIKRQSLKSAAFEVPSSKVTTTTIEDYEKSKRRSSLKRSKALDNYSGPKTIAEVTIPQVTRKSKFYSASNNRLSVLSIYSTRESFTDLASKLRELETPGDNLDYLQQKRSSLLFDSSNKRASTAQKPISMIPEESSSGLANDASFNNQAGLRLSYADRLSALRQPSQPQLSKKLDKEEQNQANPIIGVGQEIEGGKRLELPELPEHFDPIIAKRSSLKPPHQSSKERRSKIEIFQDDEVMESKPLPKPTEKVDKQNSVSTTQITPLGDKTNKSNEQKRTASGSSFFRKWSSSSKSSQSTSGSKQSSSFFGNLFGSNTILEGKTLNTVYEPTEMYTTLKRLLSSWNDYGLRNINANDQTHEITGEVSKNNVFGLSSLRFKVEIGRFGKKGSSVRFVKTKGSKKGFKMLESEVERILNRENVLAFAN